MSRAVGAGGWGLGVGGWRLEVGGWRFGPQGRSANGSPPTSTTRSEGYPRIKSRSTYTVCRSREWLASLATLPTPALSSRARCSAKRPRAGTGPRSRTQERTSPNEVPGQQRTTSSGQAGGCCAAPGTTSFLGVGGRSGPGLMACGRRCANLVGSSARRQPAQRAAGLQDGVAQAFCRKQQGPVRPHRRPVQRMDE